MRSRPVPNNTAGHGKRDMFLLPKKVSNGSRHAYHRAQSSSSTHIIVRYTSNVANTGLETTALNLSICETITAFIPSQPAESSLSIVSVGPPGKEGDNLPGASTRRAPTR